MISRRGKSTICGALEMLIGLATRRYGLTMVEMMREARVSRASAFSHLRTLERLGVQITKHKEPVRSSWRMLYRLNSIRGFRMVPPIVRES